MERSTCNIPFPVEANRTSDKPSCIIAFASVASRASLAALATLTSFAALAALAITFTATLAAGLALVGSLSISRDSLGPQSHTNLIGS